MLCSPAPTGVVREPRNLIVAATSKSRARPSPVTMTPADEGPRRCGRRAAGLAISLAVDDTGGGPVSTLTRVALVSVGSIASLDAGGSHGSFDVVRPFLLDA